MAIFDKAYIKLAEIEGGYVNHPSDPGGATNFGVSLRTLKTLKDSDGDGWLDGDLDRDGDVDIDDIKAMTPEQAKEFYFDRFWTRYKYSLIQNQLIADKLLSFSVHMGPGRAHRIIQTATEYHRPIAIDGILGTKSFAAINTIGPERILVELKHEAARFYRSLIADNSELGEFINGWLRRAYSV